MNRQLVVAVTCLLVALGAVAWGQAGRREAPARIADTPSARVAVPTESGRVVTSFSLRPDERVFSWAFEAIAEGSYTAGANWTSLPAVQLTLTVSGGDLRELSASGPPPLSLPFPAQVGQRYTLTLSAREIGRDGIQGQLAVQPGRGRELEKRASPRATPMSPEALGLAGTPEVRDPVLPLLATLAERRLTGARDRNELDDAFDRMLSRYPAVTDPMLRRFVAAFRALRPEQVSGRFTTLRRQPGDLRAVSPEELTFAFREAGQTYSVDQIGGPLVAAGAVRVGQAVPAPHIAALSPKAPLLGYPRGAQVNVEGSGFSASADQNKVEMRAAEPQKIGAKSFILAPQTASGEQLQVTLPVDMPSAKWLLTVSVGSKQSNEVAFWTSNLAVPGAVPGPAITGLDPAGRQPSQQVLVNGSNFQPGLLNRVVFANIDLPNGPSYFADAKVLSKTQLQVTIPELAVPGKHTVRVLIPGWPYSDAKTYDIGAPRYRVVFLKMICDDESDPEWSGDDELVTFWTAAADAQVWAKNSAEYTGFEDGTVKNYSTGDALVLPATGGQWAPVKWALAVNAQLYEWDAGDIKASQEFVGFVGEYGSYAAALAWGPEAGVATKLIAALVAEAIGRFSSWLGGDPDSLGKRQIAYTGAELQALLQPGASVDGTLNFHNSDDEGGYRLTYRLSRE